jgi:hypothetical protein
LLRSVASLWAAPMSGQPKARLLTLNSLDQRTVAAKQARETISAIETDFGGAENIATAKRQIIESAAVTSAMVADLGSRWLAGEQIDLGLFTTLCNSQRRLLESIGFERIAKDLTPSVNAYLAQKNSTET